MQEAEEAEMQAAKRESEQRLAAMRKDLLAAEDAERAELEHEYKYAHDITYLQKSCTFFMRQLLATAPRSSLLLP